MATYEAPKVSVFTQPVPAVGAGADLVTPVCRAPFAGTITGVTYTALTTMTGAATNNRTLSLINKGAGGSGTTVAASLAMSVNTVVCTAYDEKAIPLSGTAADLVVAEGDILAFSSVHIGSGIADTSGLVTVTITREA